MFKLLALLPPQMAAPLIASAGIALIFQARRLAVGLFLAGLGVLLLPTLIAPIRALIPGWLLLILALGSLLAVGRAALTLSLGRAAADHTVGILAADLIRFLFLLPFRLIGTLLTYLFRRGAH